MARLIAERPAVPKRIQILPSVPITAIGKVYKPQLRAEAARHAMAALLEQRGLADRAAVDVEEAAGGLKVCFSSPDDVLDATIRELMAPFALKYAIFRRGRQ